MATNKQEQAKAIYELWDVILQHRWRFVLPAFAVTAVVLFVSLFLPRKYEAVAYFERRNAPELIEAIRSGASDSYIDPMAALTKEIAGSHAINQVINELEPELYKAGYVSNATELRELRTMVKQQMIVRRESADRMHMQLRLQLVLDDPYLGAKIVNALVDRYMKTTRDALVERAASSIAYFDSLIADHRKELEAKQKDLGMFEQEHAILLPNQPYSIESQIAEAKEELAMLTTNLGVLESQRRNLKAALQSEPKTLPSTVHGKNPELIRLEDKLDKLQDKIRQFTTTLRMTEQHPEVVALREQENELLATISDTQASIITSTEEHPNPKRTEIELALTSAKAESEALKEQITLRHDKINKLSDLTPEMLAVRGEHLKLEDLVKQSQQDVDDYQKMRRRAEFYLTPETGERGVQMNFISRAEPVTIPVSPKLAQVIIVAGFLGIASGALSVFIAHRADDSYRNARQVAESTTIPMLGSVSELITRQHRRMRRLRHSIIYPMNAVVMTIILLTFGSALYIDLQRPDVMKNIKDQAKEYLTSNPMEKVTAPPTSVGLRSPDKPQG